MDLGHSHPSKRLTSWKQIAFYLQCEERTAQRWERDRRLPVHRIPGDKRGTVYAFPEEIDGWLRRCRAEIDPVVHGSTIAPMDVVTKQLAEGPAAGAKGLMASKGLRSIRSAIWPTLALVAIAVLSLRFLSSTQLAHEIRDLVPAKHRYAEKELIVQNRSGETLWTYRLEDLLRMEEADLESGPRVQFADLENDGSMEVVAAVGHAQDFPPGAAPQFDLFCFEADGKLRWKYRFSDSLTFGAKKYDPPFTIRALLIAGEERKHIWAAYVHNPWWPTALVKLDADGREVERFVNAGYIYSLAHLRTPEGAFILAGGVNNERNAGMLAVIEANRSGSSPQSARSQFECMGCPLGRPARYFSFPRSELNQITASPYNAIYSIRLLGDRFDAVAWETESKQRSETHYEFDLSFRLIAAHRGDAYWNVHRTHELQGLLRHPTERCPERDRPLSIHEWKDGHWSETRPTGMVSQSK